MFYEFIIPIGIALILTYVALLIRYVRTVSNADKRRHKAERTIAHDSRPGSYYQISQQALRDKRKEYLN